MGHRTAGPGRQPADPGQLLGLTRAPQPRRGSGPPATAMPPGEHARPGGIVQCLHRGARALLFRSGQADDPGGQLGTAPRQRPASASSRAGEQRRRRMRRPRGAMTRTGPGPANSSCPGGPRQRGCDEAGEQSKAKALDPRQHHLSRLTSSAERHCAASAASPGPEDLLNLGAIRIGYSSDVAPRRAGSGIAVPGAHVPPRFDRDRPA